ncbi:MAG: hypothetical protein RLY31_1449 [Bacteroidota bacterium]|jgi:proteasome lid subunit RPN8/RPN11
MSCFQLSIDPAVAAVIRRQAELNYPYECCGFLFGTDVPHRHMAVALPVDNNKEGDQRRRFEISVRDYMRAEAYAAQHDLTLLGVYHSHPDHPAIASEHDLAVAMPFFSYVIISVRNGCAADLKSWRLQETGHRAFTEESVGEASAAAVFAEH